MAIATDLTSREQTKFLESTAVSGQPGIVVINPDGTSIASSASSAITSIIPGTGATNLGKEEDAAHTSGDVGVMSLAVRNDAGSVLAGTTGDYVPLTTDANGNLRTSKVVVHTAASTYACAPTKNKSFTSFNAKNTAGCLVYFSAKNTTGATVYLQLHNKASAASSSEESLESFLIPANSQIVWGAEDSGHTDGFYFSTGITFANSTTLDIYTAGSAGDISLTYKVI